MSPITVLNTSYGKLYYHPDQKIVHHKFHQSLDSAHLREILNTGVELLTKHQAVKWLSDNREIDAHSPEDTEWANTVWIANAVAAGWKFWALVVPDSIMARMNMSEFVQEFYKQGVRIMVFVDPDEAMNWLINVDRS